MRVQVYYVERAGPLTEELRRILEHEDMVEVRLRGRLLSLRRRHDEPDLPILAQVWGVRHLMTPGHAPISAGRWEYGQLDWPDIGPITDDTARRLGLSAVAYVRDDVLDAYEGRREFIVHPESGSVSYGGQWSVGRTYRIGRDLIAMDIKKLYEGTPPETVRHWHTHAVAPPSGARGPDDGPNVGTRARRIVQGLTDLGEALAHLASPVLGQSLRGKDITGLDRTDLNYQGWWRAKHVEPIGRHIPLALDQVAFLARCNDLYKLVAEGLGEAWLRRLLVALGIPPDDIKSYRSLKLLDLLIRLADLAERSGLCLDDGPELLARLPGAPVTSPLASLFALTSLRQLADHRMDTSTQRKLDEALKTFDLDPAAYVGGWGAALDVVYDSIGATLETAAATLASAISSH